MATHTGEEGTEEEVMEGEEGTEEEVMPGLTEAEAEALAQQLYVAYYGRPADPGGLAFWTNQFMDSTNLDAAIDAHGNSPEFEALSADKTSEELVTDLYQRMFSRDPEPAGLEFYVGRLDSGEATLASIAKQVADGAVDEDATTLANKVAVANAFTAAVVEGVVYDAAGISAAAALLAAVDDAEGAVAAGEAEIEDLVALMDGGMAYTLVGAMAGRDLIESGYGDDTYTGTSGTVQATDAILDASTDDHDTLTITNTHTVEAISVSNVEYVSVVQNLFDGVVLAAGNPAAGSPEIKLANVEGATVTVSSEKLGYDHRAYVTGVYDNTLVAGDGVTELLIVGDLDDGTVNLGSVKEAVICTIAELPPGAAADDKDTTGPTLMINGDIKLRVKGSNPDQTEPDPAPDAYSVAPNYTLMGTADATVTLNAARTGGNDDDTTALVPFTVAGPGSLTLMMANAGGAKISNKATGDLMVVSAAADVTEVDVSGVESAVTFSGVMADPTAVTAADGQMIVFSKAQTAVITVKGAAPAAGTTALPNLAVTATDLGTAMRNAQGGVDTTGGITFTDAASATLTVVGAGADAKAATVGVLDSGDISVDVVSSLDALTVSTLTASDADFTGVTGALTINSITVNSEVTGGSGKNVVSLTLPTDTDGFGDTLGYTGGAGVDTVVATNIGEDGRVEAHLGAGNDQIVVRVANPGARVAVDGGAGTDTLVVQAGVEGGQTGPADISTFARLHMTSIEALAFAGTPGKDNPDTKDRDETVEEALLVTMSLAQLAPKFIVALADSKVAGGTGVDSVTITVIDVVDGKESASIDLSHLTILDAEKTTFVLTGDEGQVPEMLKATTIVGSGGNDMIIGGAFDGDTLSGGRGADTFVFASGDSYRAADATATPAVTLAYDTIMDFNRSQGDVIDLNGGDAAAILGDVGPTIVTGDAVAVFVGSTSDVNFQIKAGVLTLEGLSADRDMADTLDEWLILANAASVDEGVLAFVFKGDTYVFDGGSGDAVKNLIKLEGVTGITLDLATQAVLAAEPDSDVTVADNAILIG